MTIMFNSPLLALSALVPYASAAVWNVTVGADSQLRYNPENITAAEGDTVRFIFNPKNHTVTQSAFSPPCIPLAGGVTSGFHPVAANTSTADQPIYDFTVPAGGKPLWFFCEQTGHCGEGMVFSINAPATGNTFEAFQQSAIAQNGTGSSSSSSSTASSVGSYSAPPPVISTVTVTVSLPSTTYATTYASWAGSAAPTPNAAGPQNHVVQVGPSGDLVYSPANITADINDTVTFVFNPKNHTVTQSTFPKPCVAKEGGFDTGFTHAVASGTSSTNFTITVNDTQPIWVYCRQENHCGEGMVFAVNAVADSPNNFTAFLNEAKAQNGSSSTSSSSSSSSAASSTGSSGKSGALPMANVPALSMVGASIALMVITGFGLLF